MDLPSFSNEIIQISCMHGCMHAYEVSLLIKKCDFFGGGATNYTKIHY